MKNVFLQVYYDPAHWLLMNANVGGRAFLWSPEAKQDIRQQVQKLDENIQIQTISFSLTNTTGCVCQQMKLGLKHRTLLNMNLDQCMDDFCKINIFKQADKLVYYKKIFDHTG